MSVTIKAVSEPNCCGEGPHWDQSTGSLLYVNIPEGEIHRYFPQTKRHQVFTVEQCGSEKDVSFVLPVAGHPEVLIIGHGHRIAAVKWSPADPDQTTGKCIVLDTVEEDKNTRFNDAKCDPRGRIWAGTMGLYKSPAVREPYQGNLYKCGRAQRATKMIDKVSISNGLAWSEDRSTFYFIDSDTFKVEAFDYNEDAGDIGNRRTVYDLKEAGLEEHIPDGMTIDVDGKLWVACFKASKILHIDPVKKTLLRFVELPAINITSVCWGGHDYDVLYATTAFRCLSPQQLQDRPLSGATFEITGLATKGFPPVEVKLCEKVRQKIDAEFEKA